MASSDSTSNHMPCRCRHVEIFRILANRYLGFLWTDIGKRGVDLYVFEGVETDFNVYFVLRRAVFEIFSRYA